MNRLFIALGGLVLVASLTMSPLAASAATKAPHAWGHHGGMPNVLNAIATVEGVTPAVLQQDLAAGQTLLQIAGSKYSSAGELATALLAPLKARLDAAVSANKLTATRESTLYSKLYTAVSTLVVTPHPTLRMLFGALVGGKHGNGHRLGRGAGVPKVAGGLLATLVTTCNTTAANLRAAIHTGGESILAVCQATNPSVTETSLVASLSGALKTKLDAAVAANKLSASQESTILAKVQARLATWVTTTLPAGGGRHY